MDWSYVAGYFDGEGCIRSHKTGVELNFANTHVDSLRAIQSFLGCGHINKHFTRTNFNCYILTMSHHEDVLRVAEGMLQFSIIKKQRLERMIFYIKGRRWSRRSRTKLFAGQIKKEDLERLYLEEKNSMKKIAEIYGLDGYHAILYWMKKFGIPRRTISEGTRLAILKRKEPVKVCSSLTTV